MLAVFDEVAQIGPLKILTDCLGMGAGAAALRLMLVYQNVGQMMSQFGTNNFQTVAANSGCAMYFGVRDQQTAEFVSKQCGITEVLSRGRDVTIDPRTGEPNVNDNMSQTARLLHPDEIRFGLRDDEMLMSCDRVPGVVRAKRVPFFRCLDLRGRWRENPYFQKRGFLSRLFE